MILGVARVFARKTKFDDLHPSPPAMKYIPYLVKHFLLRILHGI